jgi:hypothetical protein
MWRGKEALCDDCGATLSAEEVMDNTTLIRDPAGLTARLARGGGPGDE